MIRLDGNQIATGHDNGDVVIWTIIGSAFSYYRIHLVKFGITNISSLVHWTDDQLVAYGNGQIFKHNLRTCHGSMRCIVGVTFDHIGPLKYDGKPVIYCYNGVDVDVRDIDTDGHMYFNLGGFIVCQLPDERLVIRKGPLDVRIVNMKDKSSMGLVNTHFAAKTYTRQDIQQFHNQLAVYLAPYLPTDLFDIVGAFF
jgi:hypothetical protein